MTTIASLLRRASGALCRAGIPGPRLDAEVLLASSLGKDRAWLAGRPDAEVRDGALRRFQARIDDRVRGSCVAHATGEREFFGLPFLVTRGAFVPRPETEGLVERASALRRAFGGCRLLDACTGCGNVALAARVAAGFPRVGATDLSPEALATARMNAWRLGADVEFRRGDLLEPFLGTPWRGRTDVVCANPPYVPSAELPGLPREVRREPRLALDGGADGLEILRRLAPMALDALRPGGFLVAEIGDGQGEAAVRAALDAGFAGARFEADLAGLDRYLLAWKRTACRPR